MILYIREGQRRHRGMEKKTTAGRKLLVSLQMNGINVDVTILNTEGEAEKEI